MEEFWNDEVQQMDTDTNTIKSNTRSTPSILIMISIYTYTCHHQQIRG